MKSIQGLIRQIHASAGRIVMACTGGGSGAVEAVLAVPGASRTVLEAIVPYGEASLADWLGGTPDQACSPQTARAMAMAAFFRARRLEHSQTPLAGFGLTASLATDRPKRGPHRIHAAIQTVERTRIHSLTLNKGHRTRAREERIASRVALNLLAVACEVAGRVKVDLLDGEKLEESEVVAPRPWQNLLLGRVDRVSHGEPSGREATPPRAVMSGAFHPIHSGHQRMLDIARSVLGAPVDLELSILNVDKPPLDYLELERRLGQFAPGQGVWLTRSATFLEKSQLFGGATFVVGTDTLARIVDPAYYGNDPAACRRALARIAGRGCRFLVFGRDSGGGFVGLDDLALPPAFAALCREIPATEFHENISSTEIRRKRRR